MDENSCVHGGDPGDCDSCEADRAEAAHEEAMAEAATSSCVHGTLLDDYCEDCDEDRRIEQAMNRTEESGELSFGAALAYLKQGKRIARQGWNGKGMWLVLVHPMLVGFPERTAGYDLNIGPHSPKELSEVTPLPWIGMKTADNKFVPWLASQTDILSEDWEVVE
jgi:Protein of unknown function (DUF2829)